MIKKFIKKIGKGIRTGLKSIGKAFKKAFKGIGKFIGKLGPIGMLGMMLIMPQMASWWGSFGKWAGTLGKGFGTVMRGVHKAGTLVGKAYSTVTDTISGTMNKITGGSFARPGGEGLFAGEYVEGASDKLANWMSSTMDSAREGLGLETTTPINTPDLTDASSVVETTVVPDASSVVETTVVPDTMAGPDFISGQTDLEVTGGARIKDGNIVDTSGADKITNVTGEPSTFDQIKKYGTTAYTTASTVRSGLEDFGLLDEDIGAGYAGLGPMSAAVDTQIQAQDDWAAMGMGGELPWGNTIALWNSIYGQA